MSAQPETHTDTTRTSATIDTPAFAALLGVVVGFVAFVLVEGSGEEGILAFAAFWAVWTVAAVLLGLRSATRGDSGSASAWLAFGLPAPLFLAVLALPLIHPHYLLGQSQCDPSTLFCDDSPAPTGNWVPLIFFVIAVIAVFRALRRSRHNARVT